MADKNFKVKTGLTLPSPLPVDQGGTGQTSATNAINALLPVQNAGTENYAIQSDGTNVSWAKVYNQLIKDSGTSVNPRRSINFVGATFSDSSGTDTTTITVGGGDSETYALMGVY